MPSPHRSSAWPLAAVCAALIAYASLHPFGGWRWPPELSLWQAMRSLPLSTRYASRFDILSNLLAYLPLGLLLATAQLREGAPVWRAVLLATLVASALSFAMEVAQHALPTRVPSRLDWLLNSAGALLGALLAAAVQRAGGWRRWEQWRARWFLRGQGGGLALLLLWPVGQLFPPALPFGLGQVLTRARLEVAAWLQGTAWDGWLAPTTTAAITPLAPGLIAVGVACGLLAPILLAYALTPPGARRLALLLGALLLALGTVTLSTTLNFGPEHALAWWTEPVGAGAALAVAAAVPLAWVSARAAAAVALPVIAISVALVNLAPEDPFYAASLQGWEQGRFIRFHGLAQWIGWGWPFAAAAYLLSRLAAPGDGERKPTIPA
ncbi:VanZ family protein [Rivibacter subsaxonicus]|uniref:VanZ like protein n=1 Tax=Rivibacter subsaxonicus TaxID=457575 RepID=A0A4Q7VVF5_9BURK|nr:VanZ family protein [Rivibacter subsaxonicus]RZU00563.1 VanZ like protein [Rivibacter subsaxonicus]